MSDTADIARGVLAGVRLERFIADDGPTDACWEAVEAGTLSSGERVLVALALVIMDYTPPASARIGDLARLDRDNLRRVGEALLALAERS